ncbi:cation:proton antiporter [Candidatus Venteria ishoeyi]|uniref:cation:proton antiporter n=1 Tax=Candidatus Venteria ishoeyi TaxID=1899563 RepID=UPI0025A5D06B|nr:cation:proton antiporter [Candidatus Venteria ishoeyi]MDM8547328.1 cation:proton antiporter [Candidatus Venteria ishoeyi]
MSPEPGLTSPFFMIAVVFSGAAFIATLALYARQALLLAYIAAGILLGPWGVNFITVEDAPRLKESAHIGIVFLLFLLGMNLQPRNLLDMLSKTSLLTLLTSFIFSSIGLVLGLLFGYNMVDALMIGVAMMFSSTILGLKLLPTTVLHHKHTGEIIVSVLLLQDIIAILVLLVLKGLNHDQDNTPFIDIAISIASLPFLIALAWGFGRYVLLFLMRRFNKIQEYMFLMAIGWCMSMAELAAHLNLSHEIGAFIAGVVLATSPVALFLTESLKPLRDFFLVMFFFSLGASLQLEMLQNIFWPALLLAGLILLIKPFVFKYILIFFKETPQLSMETGVRLGQVSEFSLLIAVMAQDFQVISLNASYLIQVATILTFVVSSWFIVMHYPNPIAVSDRLRRD